MDVTLIAELLLGFLVLLQEEKAAVASAREPSSASPWAQQPSSQYSVRAAAPCCWVCDPSMLAAHNLTDTLLHCASLVKVAYRTRVVWFSMRDDDMDSAVLALLAWCRHRRPATEKASAPPPRRESPPKPKKVSSA